MLYTTYSNSLEYFNSIPSYGRAVAETNSECYNIKFNCNIELARAVWRDFVGVRPDLKKYLQYHVNLKGTAVLFGGRFPQESRAKNLLYDLIDKHKELNGKYKAA
jgi:hypothetical protein